MKGTARVPARATCAHAPGRDGSAEARLSTTAYIAWAVFRGSQTEAEATRHFLLGHRPAIAVGPGQKDDNGLDNIAAIRYP